MIVTEAILEMGTEKKGGWVPRLFHNGLELMVTEAILEMGTEKNGKWGAKLFSSWPKLIDLLS